MGGNKFHSLGGCWTTRLAFLPKCLQPLCQAGDDVEGIFRVGIQDLCPHPCVRFVAQQQQAVEILAVQRVQVIEVGYPGFIFYFGIYF